VLLATTFLVVVGFGAAHARWVGHYPFLTGSRLGWELAYATILSVTAYAAGLPDRTAYPLASLGQAVPAVGAAAVVISLIQTVSGSQLLPRLVVAGSALLLTPAYVGAAALSQRQRADRGRRERILVVADADDVAALEQDLLERPEQPASIVGAAPLGEIAGRGTEAQPLVELAASCRPTVLVLGRAAAVTDTVVTQAAILHESGIRVRTLSLFYEEWMAKLPIGELERVSLMFDIGELHRARYGRLKRLLDISAGLIGLLATGIVLPGVAVLNLLANRGPLFFRQQRIGKSGEVFSIIKFRTMRETSDDCSSWTEKGDPRLTAGGALMRRLHLDELPNFANVLSGEMSLVGPRPEQPGYVDELAGKLPFYTMRHLVRPGITGWAQVNYGYASDQWGALQKLQYDFYYLRHQGLSLDLRVIGRTMRAVLSGR
jgi:lipopolysaccharide/colanic/teichoic acid biosynthesis glycosyltransferase